ncbi:enhancer of rudimentary family protein [Acanthamoeba castellanii str. Neff]|uniref:Enhancer of rudimentary family protein n=1 Tax=Acanthamoeba castellanii (strain ATCC 30010 / Neff) TaxID=1257118 RepID=L8GJD9_ACACF|nr:enhancer of rudimentary family protein [Acanthamoeba castellanii str. Neff]ELR12868.1 enhancer of rudimentary family protein [Acanthamoeba castellanii str. Neff]
MSHPRDNRSSYQTQQAGHRSGPRKEKVQKHTIVLVQFTADRKTRTYSDFESVGAAMEGILKLYEQKLKTMNPSAARITYDIKDLYDYIDSLVDMSCMVYNPELQAYNPFNKDWIKQRLLVQLKKMAGQRA